MDATLRHRCNEMLKAIRDYDLEVNYEWSGTLDTDYLIERNEQATILVDDWRESYPGDEALVALCGAYETFGLLLAGHHTVVFPPLDIRAVPSEVVLSVGSWMVPIARAYYHLIDTDMDSADGATDDGYDGGGC